VCSPQTQQCNNVNILVSPVSALRSRNLTCQSLSRSHFVRKAILGEPRSLRCGHLVPLAVTCCHLLLLPTFWGKLSWILATYLPTSYLLPPTSIEPKFGEKRIVFETQVFFGQKPRFLHKLLAVTLLTKIPGLTITAGRVLGH